MSGNHDTPIGTPVVLAPGRVVLVGEYAALAEGNTVEAAFGCYAKAQFVPQMDSVMTLVSEIIERIESELAEVAPALPPGSVLLTSEDFRAAGGVAAGLGGSAAMAVATVGAVLESLGMALEVQKPLVSRIANAARRKTQGYLGSGADTAAATFGGLIRAGRAPDGQRQLVPLAPPAGLHLVVFSAGPSLPPANVARALEHHARESSVSFLEAVAKLRGLAQRFLDEVSIGQTTAAIAAAGKYGEVMQGLCAAAQAPIMTEAFTRAAQLAREFGGIAKPTGAGGGEIGVALFATPEATQHFRKACTEPLHALDGDLDVAGVRREFPDNAIGADLDERESAELPEPEPDEFSMPTVKSASPLLASLSEASTARCPVEGQPPHAGAASNEQSSHRARWLVLALLGLVAAVGGGFALVRIFQAPAPLTTRSTPSHAEPPPTTGFSPGNVVEASVPEPPATVGARAQVGIQPTPAPKSVTTGIHRKPGGHVTKSRPPGHRAGRLSPDDF